MIQLESGYIFNSQAQTVSNTVNCVGAMGKGKALVFMLRKPSMFGIYKKQCKAKRILPKKLWLYKEEENAPWVLNFLTKYHWKYPTKIDCLNLGLKNF